MSLPALHVNRSGNVIDATGTLVIFRGVNTEGTEFGNAIGDAANFGNSATAQARITAVSSLLHLNLWRLTVNVSWWINNVLLTDGITRYQTWIQTLVSYIEQANCYVEVNAGPSFCTAPGSPGPGQDTQDSCNATETLDLTATSTFWQSFVPLYKNDPMVLYDVKNEPTYDDTVTQLQSLIRTIQGIAPSAVCIAYNFNAVASSYAASPNVIVSFHLYDDPNNWWWQKIYNHLSLYASTQANGTGIYIEETNVRSSTTWNPTGFAAELVRRAFASGIGIAYYTNANLVATDNATLSAEGQIVASIYAQIAAGQKVWYGA